MLRWVSSLFSGNQKVSVEGLFHKYQTEAQPPKAIFVPAILSIDSTKAKFAHEIEITNPNAEDDDDKYTFKLSPKMMFSIVEDGSNRAFAWKGEGSEYHIWYVFTLAKQGDVQATANSVKQLACNCIYENLYKTTPQKEDLEEIEGFCTKIDLPFELDTFSLKKKSTTSTPARQSVAPSTTTPAATATTSTPAKPSQQPSTTPAKPAAPTPQAGSSKPAPSPAPKEESPVTSVAPVYPTIENSYEGEDEEEEEEELEEQELARASVDLYKFNSDTNIFELQMQDCAALILRMGDLANYHYLLSVDKGEDVVIQQVVNVDMQAQFFNQTHSVVWTLQEPLMVLSVVFKNQEEEKHFEKCLSASIFEASHKIPITKVPEEDQEAMLLSRFNDLLLDEKESTGSDSFSEEELLDFTDEPQPPTPQSSPAKPATSVTVVKETPKKPSPIKSTPTKRVVMSTPSKISRIEESDDSEEEEEPEEEESEEEEEDDDQGGRTPIKSPFRTPSKAKNSLLADSYKHNRTFVVRGSDINVFGKDEDDLEYKNSISGLKTPEGKIFSPARVMLHQQDSKLLCVHPDQDDDSKFRGTVYNLDIEKGKIVQEWNAVDNYFPINELAPIQKYAQQTDESLFAALSNNTVFALDPRSSERNKAVGNILEFSLKKNPEFSCLATTQDGRVAVGSYKGDIRLYSGVPGTKKSEKGKATHPKTAKTLLAGVGEPVNFIDVTADGRWIVATSTKCLFVISTEMKSGDSGFTAKMGKEKPTPRRLNLLPEDVIRVGGKVKFTPARFNTGCDGELWIVTSTGPFIVTWNFKKVQQNNTACYSIKKMEETVVADQFVNVPHNTPGRSAPIIVAMEDNVKLEKRTKVSGTTPNKQRTKYNK